MNEAIEHVETFKIALEEHFIMRKGLKMPLWKTILNKIGKKIVGETISKIIGDIIDSIDSSQIR